MLVAGVEWGAHTELHANQRSFGGWTRVSKKLRRFGGYHQNFISEWPSLWGSNWAEILFENVSRVEEHPLKISCDLHSWFGRCFKTAGESWAHRARFVGIWHCRRGPLWDTGRLALAFFANFFLVVARVEWRAHTKFQANRRSFGGWTSVLKKLRRFGSYRQNFILEWPSMWCSNGDEILCGNNSLLEEHLVKNSHDFHARFGRDFKTAGESWAHCARFVGIWNSQRGPLWDTGRLAHAFLAKFYMVIAAVEWGAHTKFQANRRLFGE